MYLIFKLFSPSRILLRLSFEEISKYSVSFGAFLIIVKSSSDFESKILNGFLSSLITLSFDSLFL